MKVILNCSVARAKELLEPLSFKMICNDVCEMGEAVLYVKDTYSIRNNSNFGVLIHISNFSGSTVLTSQVLGAATGLLAFDWGKSGSVQKKIFKTFEGYVVETIEN